MRFGFRHQIIGGMLLVGIIPPLVLSGVFLTLQYRSLMHQTRESVEAANSLTSARLADAIGFVQTQVREEANEPMVLEALEAFTKGIEILDTTSIAVDHAKINQRYALQQQKTLGTQPQDVDKWIPHDPKALALQHLYTSGSPHAVGESRSSMMPVTAARIRLRMQSFIRYSGALSRSLATTTTS